MSLSAIVAASNNNCIGKDNQLLWKIPADMKFFKETTTGHTIIMGKKTFASIGRPLPNRRSIVLTRDKTYSSEGIEIFNSVEEVISLFKDSEEEAFVIGGGEIYNQFFPYLQKIYITHVYENFEGDTFFPEIPKAQWTKTTSSLLEPEETTPYQIEFATYTRN